MCFFKKNNIQLEMNMVIKNLGYNRVESIPKRILKEIKNSIDEVKDLIQLEIIWQEYEFEIDKKKHRIKFSEDIYIDNKHLFTNLCKADKLVIGIGTIGNFIDEKVNEFILEKKYLKVIVYEAIGETALNQSNSDFRLRFVEKNNESGIGVTRGFYPGTNKWSLEDQKIIFLLLDGSKIGVKLSEGYMMMPRNSFSVIYGLGKKIKTPDLKYKCVYCNLDQCRYRNLDMKILI